MPEAQGTVEILTWADREDASCRDDPIVSNNHAAIMEGCFREENRYQEFLRHVAVDIDAALGEGSDRGIALDGQQCADLSACQFEHRFGNDVNCFFLLGRRREKLAAPKFRQGPSQLRL